LAGVVDGEDAHRVARATVEPVDDELFARARHA
jgi:hypothetical protein